MEIPETRFCDMKVVTGFNSDANYRIDSIVQNEKTKEIFAVDVNSFKYHNEDDNLIEDYKRYQCIEQVNNCNLLVVVCADKPFEGKTISQYKELSLDVLKKDYLNFILRKDKENNINLGKYIKEDNLYMFFQDEKESIENCIKQLLRKIYNIDNVNINCRKDSLKIGLFSKKKFMKCKVEKEEDIIDKEILLEEIDYK